MSVHFNHHGDLDTTTTSKWLAFVCRHSRSQYHQKIASARPHLLVSSPASLSSVSRPTGSRSELTGAQQTNPHSSPNMYRLPLLLEIGAH